MEIKIQISENELEMIVLEHCKRILGMEGDYDINIKAYAGGVCTFSPTVKQEMNNGFCPQCTGPLVRVDTWVCSCGYRKVATNEKAGIHKAGEQENG